MIKTLLIIVCILTCMGSLQLKAQDTTVCTPEKICNALVINNILAEYPDTLPVDTGISNFHQLPAFNHLVHFPALTGPTGRPAIDLFRTDEPDGSDYIYRNPYRNYGLNTGNLEVIRSGTPFSEWYYLIGAHREQIFRATHAQNAGKGLNFGLDLKFINAKGAYRHEHTKTNSIALYGEYRHQTAPLVSRLFFFSNGIVQEENGGIADPGYFEDTALINRQLAPVWLEYAVNSHRSTELVSKTDWKRWSFTLRALREWYLYRDADPFNDWYSLTRYDTTVTFDSLHYQAVSGDFAYNFTVLKKITGAAGIMAQAYGYYDTLNPEGQGRFLSPYFQLQTPLFPGFNFRAEASATSDPDFGTIHHLLASLLWKPTSQTTLEVKVSDRTSFPYRQDMAYASNHFIWLRNMDNAHTSRLDALLHIRGKHPVELLATACRLTGYIYYNKQALPNQYLGDIYLYQFLAFTEGSLGRLSYRTTIAFQKSVDEESILRQPALLGELNAGYHFTLFDGKISAISGVILRGRSSAYVDQWMPVTRVFYHTSLPVVDGYLWADPYLTFLLKKTRFMLKYEHATAWLAGFGEYSVPGYPMSDPALKFAVAWRFMD
jgi:hypothetical protein